MSLGEVSDSAALVVEAVQRAGVQAVVQGLDRVLADAPLSTNIYRAGSIPLTWLFQQVGAVVHQGGFGTTSSTFRVGIPSVVIRHILDQFIWGKHVHELGCGPQPIPRTKLMVQSPTAALVETAQNAVWQQNTCRLGEGIRAETGVENAVRLIEGMLIAPLNITAA